MKSWILAATALGCLTVAGCRHHRNVAALEQELRLYEDRIYQLQDRLDETQDALEDARRENAALRAGGTGPARPGDAEGRRPESPEPGELKIEPGDLKIELPKTNGFESEPPESLKLPGRLAPPAAPDSPKDEAPPFGPGSPDPGAQGSQVEEIKLGPVAAGLPTAEGRIAAGAGLTVLIQPRDAEGRPVVVAAPVSVVVVDPALSGSAARIARWDVTADEVARGMLHDDPGPGLVLNLPWTTARPRHADLHLFIRYTAPDGRRLEADTPIRLPRLAQRPDLAEGPAVMTASPASWQEKSPSAPTEVVPATLDVSDSPAPRVSESPPACPAWSPDRPE